MRRSRQYQKVAMICIVAVLIVMVAALSIQGRSLSRKIAANEDLKEELTAQIEDEEARTEEIEELQEYMQSDEYIEKIAKEKIGLVNENEIIFKETD